MLTIIGTLGGAAAMKLLNKKPKDVKELHKAQEKLAALVKELEKEAKDATKEKEAALEELRKKAEELQAKVTELSSTKEEVSALKEEKNTLAETVSISEQRVQALQASNSELLQARDEVSQRNEDLLRQTNALASEMDALKLAHEESLRDYETRIESLKSSVSDIVNRMLTNAMSDADAAAAVKALGCTLEWVEPPPAPPAPTQRIEDGSATDLPNREASLTYQSGLLLGTAEGREKLQRLVASGMLRNSSASPSTSSVARIPMITFPSNMTAPKIGVPSLLSARGKPPAAPAITGGADAGAAGQRDQAPPAPQDSAPAAPRTRKVAKPIKPQSEGASSWVYTLQGGSGSTYVAKMPGEKAPPAFLVSGSDSSGFGGMGGMGDDLLSDTMGGGANMSIMKRL